MKPHTVALIACVGALCCSRFVSSENTYADDPDQTALLKTFVDELVAITPGEGKFPAAFQMGDDQGEPGERPQHRVTLTKPFEIAKFEVPQNLYAAVMGANPSRWKGPRNSVEMVSWIDANEFCQKLTAALKAEKLISEDEVIRLPTEAEWEYCCRAGTTTRFSFGDEAQNKEDVSPMASILDQFAWHTGNAAGNDPQVGALKPNPWGLYDIHGYLWELTADAWVADYEQAPTDGSPVKVSSQTNLIVIRGGSWKDPFARLSSTSRKPFRTRSKDDAVGFRCVKSKTPD